MNNKSELVYFLEKMQKSLPFKDESDFFKRIKENKEFRIKIQIIELTNRSQKLTEFLIKENS